MSGTDQPSGQPGGLSGIDTSQIAGKLLDALGPAVVKSVVEQLNANGLGAKVNSWLGRGPNEPLTVDQVRDALGNQKVQEIARSLGIPADKLAEILARDLPQAVDKASPEGTLTPGQPTTPQGQVKA